MSGSAELPLFPKVQLGDYCKCGHVASAHGTNGYICGAGKCDCKKFERREDDSKGNS